MLLFDQKSNLKSNFCNKIYSRFNKDYFTPIIIGYTALKRPILAFKLGNGKLKIILQGAMHAREYLTANLITIMAQKYCKVLHKKSKLICELNTYNLFLQKIQDFTFYFIPISNPDGVLLSLCGLQSVPQYLHSFLMSINKGSQDFSLWKANAFGVDINVNFDAEWGKGKRNIFYPNSENFVGKKANSEMETISLIKFTNIVKPNCTISYHSKGEEIYYKFYQKDTKLMRDYNLGQKLSLATSYPLVDIQGNSAGGYKDWCIQHLGIPSYTIEVGRNFLSHPLPIIELKDIWQKNKLFLAYLVAYL